MDNAQRWFVGAVLVLALGACETPGMTTSDAGRGRRDAGPRRGRTDSGMVVDTDGGLPVDDDGGGPRPGCAGRFGTARFGSGCFGGE